MQYGVKVFSDFFYFVVIAHTVSVGKNGKTVMIPRTMTGSIRDRRFGDQDQDIDYDQKSGQAPQ